MIERQPINILEFQMQKLIRQRFVLRERLAQVDDEIGKLDILLADHPIKKRTYDLNFEPVDLDRDSMYRKPKD